MFGITVKTDTEEKYQQFSGRILLSDALAQMGFAVDKPCGGNGICGKCEVVANGRRVRSCVTYVHRDTVIEKLLWQKGLSVCQSEGAAEQTIPGSWCAPLEEKVREQSEDTAGKGSNGWAPLEEKAWEQSEDTAGKGSNGWAPLVEEGYGMAIDIGTTTIAAYLYQFPDKGCVQTMGLLNQQAEYGADVISRISYCEKGGLGQLQERITGQLQELVAKMAKEKIQKYVITGNTVMLHLLTGQNPQSIAYAPFTPLSLFGEWRGNVYLPHCISGYVGADITTAILASGMYQQKRAFLVDIGTNGEMALWKDNRCICCSTAAGPALEGACIEQGMLATQGAISKVFLEGASMRYATVGGKKAVGICGTGLIDAIACMLQLGLVDDTGYLEAPVEIGDSGIFITPEDIRKVQLAKAAIRAGIETLLQECNISCGELEAFYIAGSFGSYLSLESAVRIGLFPPEVQGRARVLGNAAGTGAGMLLQNKAYLELTSRLATEAQTLELANSAFFTDSYLENMMFP